MPDSREYIAETVLTDASNMSKKGKWVRAARRAHVELTVVGGSGDSYAEVRSDGWTFYHPVPLGMNNVMIRGDRGAVDRFKAKTGEQPQKRRGLLRNPFA